MNNPLRHGIGGMRGTTGSIANQRFFAALDKLQQNQPGKQVHLEMSATRWTKRRRVRVTADALNVTVVAGTRGTAILAVEFTG